MGVAGVEGNGQAELVKLLTGGGNYSGSLTYKGKELNHYDIRELRRNKLAFVPEDRLRDGLSKNSSVNENLISTLYARQMFVKNKFFLDKNQIQAFSTQAIKDYNIKAESGADTVGMLSGGNMQKVICAREFAHADFVIADQPTRGVDVGAAKIIREKLVALRDAGAGVLLVSADLGELLSISDTIVVFYGGAITAIFKNPQEINENTLGLYMLGLKNMFTKEAAQ